MLQKYKLHDFSFKREFSYIYILYLDFEIVYIGMTRKLDERLFRHLHDKRFDSAKYIITHKFPKGEGPKRVKDKQNKVWSLADRITDFASRNPKLEELKNACEVFSINFSELNTRIKNRKKELNSSNK